MSSTITIGTAPDSWGVWFPSDPEQVPPEVFLREVAEAGYEWIELGPYGYLPTDPARAEGSARRASARRYWQGPCSSTCTARTPGTAVWTQVTDVAALTQAVGGKHIVVIPDVWRHHKTGEPVESRDLTAEQWKQMTIRPGRARAGGSLRSTGCMCSSTPMPTAMSATSRRSSDFSSRPTPSGVNLCFDTGHIAYYGGDCLELIEKYPDRIGYLHLKQVNPEIVEQVLDKDLSFPEAVRMGAMIEPPLGVPEMPPLLEAVAGLGRDIEGIIEHDLYPCAPDLPLPIAKRTMDLSELLQRRDHRFSEAADE